jgi:hypothetical protein
MKRAALVLSALGLALAGCATVKPPPRVAAQAAAPAPIAAPPPPREVVVKVPVKETCIPKTLPAAPRYPDTDAALREAGGAADRYQLLAAGRILRAKRLAVLERIIEGCR